MSLTTDTVAREVAQLSQGLRSVLEEHLEDNYGELLPHVFFGDVTRRLASLFEDGSGSARAEVDSVITFLEDRFREGEDEVQELIAVSFLENLPNPGESGYGVRELLGPSLKAELERLQP